MRDQMKIVTQLSLTISSDSLWAAILGDCHIGPHILLAQISGLNFLQTYLWPIGRYVLQYASLLWFQHNNDSQGYSNEVCQWMFENHPGCWIIQGCELQFPGLHAHVT
jgi:hypothetical protein